MTRCMVMTVMNQNKWRISATETVSLQVSNGSIRDRKTVVGQLRQAGVSRNWRLWGRDVEKDPEKRIDNLVRRF